MVLIGKNLSLLYQLGIFVPILVEIGPLVLEKKIFFLACQCVFTILSLSPIRKGQGPLKILLIPFNQGCFVPSLVGIAWPSSSREEGENVKSLQTDGRQAVRKAHLSFQFR